MSQQLKKLRASDEQLGYKNNRTVIALTMIPHLKSILDLSIAFRISQMIAPTARHRNGVRQDMNVLNMNSDDPNRFMRVSFRKQSNDTTISVLCPNVFSGSNSSRSQFGHEKLKLIADVAMWK